MKLGARTKKTQARYERHKKAHFGKGVCKLCDKKSVPTLKDFRYWRIVKNRFPWDRIASIHHLLLPKRHTTYEKLSRAEKAELEKLKPSYINRSYWIIAEATHRKKSIPGHFHLHLLVLR